MATEIVRAGSIDDISELIDKCDFLSETLILLEKFPQTVVQRPDWINMLYFERFPLVTDIDLASYTSGRIFREDFELRWEGVGGKADVVYQGEERDVPMLKVVEDELLECDPQTKYYYLFGKRLGKERVERIGDPAKLGDFAEVRIPRLLRYPVNAEGTLDYVKLMVREYTHRRTGELVMFRFQNLVEVKD